MSIKGLTDRGSAFPEIGQIRKGAAKEAGANRPGKDLPYFRVEVDANDPRGKQFTSIYGTEPVDIHVIFPFNEMERNWEAWYEAYTAGRMVARSDGEYFTYLVNVKTGEHEVINGLNSKGDRVPHREIVGSYKTQKGGEEVIKMKPVGRLKVVIPELHSLAYMTVHTTSIYDIMNISSQLEAVQSMNGGRIAGVPLTLRRRKKMISTPDLNDKSKRVRREKYLISIEADPEWVKAMLMHVKHLALPGNGLNLLPETVEQEEPTKELPAGSENEDEDEAETYGDEITEGEFEEHEESESLLEMAEDLAQDVTLAEARSFKTAKGTELGKLDAAKLTELIRLIGVNKGTPKAQLDDDERLKMAGICLASLMPENQQ
jgi:hypothetical protein